MPQESAPMDQLRGEPLRFLETEQFQEMLSVYRKLKPLSQEQPPQILRQPAERTYDFSRHLPALWTPTSQTRALSDPDSRRPPLSRESRTGERGLRLHAAWTSYDDSRWRS